LSFQTQNQQNQQTESNHDDYLYKGAKP
jgi:hypothetical protein